MFISGHLQFLFGNYLFQPCVAGERVFDRTLGRALNQRHSVVDEILRYVVAVLGNPLKRNFLFKVCNASERNKLCFADIFSVDVFTLKSDHFAAFTADSRFNCCFSSQHCFVNISFGGEVSAATLEQTKLNAANLCAGPFLKFIRKLNGKTAELSVTAA